MPDPLSILQEQFPPIAEPPPPDGCKNEPERIAQENAGRLESWKDSPAVVALSTHLKQSQGIKLVIHPDENFGLHFVSGITYQNEKRWPQALKAWDLLVDCWDDLTDLFVNGRITLDVMDSHCFRGSFLTRA